MPPLIKFTVQQRLVNKRRHAEIMRTGFERVLINHVQTTLGKHFKTVPETSPGGAYGYAPRSSGWQKRKLALTGQNLPNVFTGKMRRTLRANSRITKTQTRGRIYLRNYFPMKDSQRAELEAVSPEEKTAMVAMFREIYVAESKKTPRKRALRGRV